MSEFSARLAELYQRNEIRTMVGSSMVIGGAAVCEKISEHEIKGLGSNAWLVAGIASMICGGILTLVTLDSSLAERYLHD